MQEFLKRLIEENDALFEKTIKLNEFIKTDIFLKLSDANQYLLRKQLEVMREYSNILETRIELNK